MNLKTGSKPKFFFFALTVLACSTLILSITSCSSALKREEVDSWLARTSGNKPAEINVKGKWQDAFYDFKGAKFTPLGWGEGYFEQEGNKIKGSLGSYNIIGKVSGKTVYIVMLSAGSVYYTAKLEMSENNVLRGNYYYAKDKEQLQDYPMSLKKAE